MHCHKKIRILGTRGIPARHGGFETFAENLALYLVSRGWQVTVYCHDDVGKRVCNEVWKGIHLIRIPVQNPGPVGTIIFDLKSTLHALRERSLVLVLGYNTAVFCLFYRLKGIVNLINMDGIEWRREKWTFLQRVWLYLNEHLCFWLANHLIADHPEIKTHLSDYVPEKKITMIPYGGDHILRADKSLLEQYGLSPGEYIIVIARPEPENSILEIVSAFSRKPRGIKLVMLGLYEPKSNFYHKKVLEAASNEVLFLGPIYQKTIVQALRFYARLYVHGHRVGGTNPSLVEALGAGLPVLAHDNKFNRWVAGPDACYFRDEFECAEKLDGLLDKEDKLEYMRRASLKRHEDEFQWSNVLLQYERLLEQYCKSR